MSCRNHNYHQQHELLDRLVRGADRPTSRAALERYFRYNAPADQSFSGRWFDRFGGSGYLTRSANVISSDDILSLTHLGISHGLSELSMAAVSYQYEEICDLLSAIDREETMHEISDDRYDRVLGHKSPALALWELLRTCAGENRWVTASTLLARKRPLLIPIYDTVIRDVLGHPENVWECFWTWFHDDPDRVTATETLRAEVGVILDISLLRCLDVVLWMRNHDQNSARQAS